MAGDVHLPWVAMDIGSRPIVAYHRAPVTRYEWPVYPPNVSFGMVANWVETTCLKRAACSAFGKTSPLGVWKKGAYDLSKGREPLRTFAPPCKQDLT